MSRRKKPIIIVAAVLACIIILPLLILLVSRIGGGVPSMNGTELASPSGNAPALAADYDLRQLEGRAKKLLSGAIADAVRNGDVSLDFVARLNEDLNRALDAMAKGRVERGEQLLKQVVARGEAQLEALALADRARALNDSTYAELQRLEYLKTAFEKTYREAVETYNAGLAALNLGQFQSSVDEFEVAGAILGDLEARALQQIAGLLDSAQALIADDKLDGARAAYEQVLKIDSANADATKGLALLTSVEGIADEINAVRALEAEGELDAALAQLDALAAANPTNPFLRKQREILAERIVDRNFDALIAEADEAEANGQFEVAIAALEEAFALRASVQVEQRITEIKEKRKAARLKVLLSDGFNALKAGRYGAARDIYKEAVSLAPESSEARNGYEKASSLYLANIRYDQNLANAAKYIKEGRYPRAAKFFNDAMAARPSNVPPSKQTEEDRIRTEIKKQSVETPVVVASDKKTYVSIIRVFAPERFRDKELSLFPDVYTVKGTRRGYKTVEVELRVDATKPNHKIEVICTEKQ